MAFVKGDDRINRLGRPAGAKNKVNEVLREAITDFLSKNFEKLQKDFGKLSPSMRFKYYIELLNFSVPRLSTVQVQNEFEKLPDEQLKQIIDEIKKTAYANRNEKRND